MASASKGRIVVFSPGQEEVGGASRRSRLLTSGLAESGWRVSVLTRNGTLRSFKRHRSGNVSVLEVPGFGLRRLGAALYYFIAVPLGLGLAARSRALLGIQLFSPATVCALCGVLLRKPFVLFSTTSGTLGEASFLTSGAGASIRRALFGRAEAVVAQTDHVVDELRAVLPRTRLVTIANPASPVTRHALTGSRSALFTGRFSSEKDLPRLLAAWSKVVGRFPDARLTLAGSGGPVRSVEPALRSRVAEDPTLESSVTFPGWVSDVDGLLRAHDVYVFPSLSEGMSNSLIEACMHGRVVVLSDIPSNRAVVGDDYPLLFEAGDTDAMEEALVTAFEDREIRERAVSMLDVRTSSFSLDKVIDSIEGLISGSTRSSRN